MNEICRQFDRIEEYARILKGVAEAEILADPSLGGRLTVAREGTLEVLYAPFDYVNEQARIVLVGITPGRQQARNALLEFRRQLVRGVSVKEAARAAKQFASFSGPMRSNLVAMLDYFGISKVLGIASCSELFASRGDLVHFTSALRYPVYVAGQNYNGSPPMTTTPVLRELLFGGFGQEVLRLRSAIFVPLGQKVADALLMLAESGAVDRSRVLDGLQHPSGANTERIAYLLGRKPRAALSVKTRPEPIDQARAQLRARVAEWIRA